jgi:hypothetical protein
MTPVFVLQLQLELVHRTILCSRRQRTTVLQAPKQNALQRSFATEKCVYYFINIPAKVALDTFPPV